MMTSFDNNEDKVCSLFKDDVNGSHVRSRARSCVRSHDHRSHNNGITKAQARHPIDRTVSEAVRRWLTRCS